MPFEAFHLPHLWSLPPQVLLGPIKQANYRCRGWLNYFWKDKGAFDELTLAQKGVMLDFFNTFFLFPDEFTLRNTRGFRGGPPNRVFVDNAVANTFKRQGRLALRADSGTSRFKLLQIHGSQVDRIDNIYLPSVQGYARTMLAFLKVLMGSGFVPVLRCDDMGILGLPQDGYSDTFRRLPESSGRPQSRTWVSDCLKTTAQTLFAWRGDSRSWNEVRAAGGFRCKVESGGYSRSIRVMAPWNPFSDQATRRHMYFRCSQKDNCLHTAISLTPAASSVNNTSFKVNACFPQLEELPGILRQRQRITVKVLPNRGRLRDETCFVDEVTLFFCYLPRGQQYFDTKLCQEKIRSPGFPEMAVRGLQSDNILGYITYIRVHHGTTNSHGFTAIPVMDKSALIDKPYYPAGARAVYAAAQVQFAAAWAVDGWGAPAPPNGVWQDLSQVTIQKVGNMDVEGGKIAQYSAYKARAEDLEEQDEDW
jgi:hypothetical protein